MRFQSDDYFHIGRDHVTAGKPCQDHVLSGVMNQAAYAIVADGCSKGRHTDVGARFMSLSASAAIREHWEQMHTVSAPDTAQRVNDSQRVVVQSAQKTFGLLRDDMLATCVYAYVGEDGGLVNLRGDGVVAFVDTTGTLTLYRFDWDNNAPFYPAYAEENLSAVMNVYGGPTALALQSEVWTLQSNSRFEQIAETKYSVAEGVKGITIPISMAMLENLAVVAVFTDGVTQVENIDWKDAAMQLLAFKGTEGDFAKRRMIKFIKEAQKSGKGPQDDIGYAVVLVHHDTP